MPINTDERWPVTKGIKNQGDVERLLTKHRRTINACKEAGRAVNKEINRLVEALEWALDEISRLKGNDNGR